MKGWNRKDHQSLLPAHLQKSTYDLSIDETVLEPERYAVAFYSEDILSGVMGTAPMPFTRDGEKVFPELPKSEQPQTATTGEAPYKTEAEAYSLRQSDVGRTDRYPCGANERIADE